METKDTLLEAFKNAAEKEQPVAFHGMEDIWQQIEAKLDEDENKKVVPLWKKWSVAATILIVLGIGGFVWMNSKTENPPTSANIKNPTITAPTVVEAKKDSIANIIGKTIVANNKKIIVPSRKHIGQDAETRTTHILRRSKQEDHASNNKGHNNIKITSSDIEEFVPMRDSLQPTLANSSKIITELPQPNIAAAQNTLSYLQGRVAGVAITNKKAQLQNNSLDEVVVVGYGTQKKKSLTGAIAAAPSTIANQNSVVTAMGMRKEYKNNSASSCCLELRDKLNHQDDYRMNTQGYIASTDLTNALQGKVAGLSIAGNPRASQNIRIRGMSTLSNHEQPLYILNGIALKSTDISSINANDITHIQVLKGAATAIYGSRAANGVIIITTKTPIQIPVSNTDAESYETYKENDFTSPVSSPFSTFSIDVDNASYTNIRRFINNGQRVPKDAVRIEEMVNFFKYHTPQPADNTPYSIQSEYGVAPWNPQHNILKISLQGKTIPDENIPASNLVFLVDVSGSMDESNKLPLLQASLKLLVNKLRAKDKVAIVTYAGNAGLVLPATSGSEKKTIIDAIDNLSAGGSTAGGAGIELAYKIGKEQFIYNGNNRVILATDGDFNVGVSSDKDMEELISEKRKDHLFLTCLGFGMGNYKDSKMQTLAQKGNGNYAYIDNIQEANRVLVKEFGGTMFTIAKDVKLQIEFNPSQVTAYRLLGYETRLLADKDFANDSIDAGEMGSGHTVTALYEIIPHGIKSDSLFKEVTHPRYLQANKSNEGSELAFVKTRYKLPNSDKSTERTITIKTKAENSSSVSNDFRLATTVAWFGLKLRDSKLVPDKTTESILEWGKSVQYDDPDGYIAELFRLIETQQP